LVLVGIHLRAVLLGAVLDRALDLRVGLRLLPVRLREVGDLGLLARLGISLAVHPVARGALGLLGAHDFRVHIGAGRSGRNQSGKHDFGEDAHGSILLAGLRWTAETQGPCLDTGIPAADALTASATSRRTSFRTGSSR